MSDSLFFPIVLAGFFVFVTVMGVINAKRDGTAFRAKLKANFGKRPGRNYTPEQIARIPRYFDKHRDLTPWCVDDITANDLDLWSVFARINYCLSAAGEEVLYHTLRTPLYDKEKLSGRKEELVFFLKEEELRTDLQMLYHRLGGSGKYSVYDYLETLSLVERKSSLPHYLGIAALVISAGIIPFFFVPGFALLLCVAVWQIVTYYRQKSESDAYLSTFSYILRLLICGDAVRDRLSKISSLPVATVERLAAITARAESLSGFRRGSSVLMSSSRMSGSGNPLDIFADYIRMLLHIDLIKFNQMVRETEAHSADIDALISALGELEAMISIVCYRASVPFNEEGNTGWCEPLFERGEDGTDSAQAARLSVKGLRHALLEEGAVANSMTVTRNVLLTGSNASGKSTWLKSLGLAVLMAQTVLTVTADAYDAPLYRIYSSMALADDLQGGESYYIVEIRSLARVLTAAEKKGEEGAGAGNAAPPVICFVDEVLRGTNTVERIAASAQILRYFAADSRVLLFAATHDLELTELLKDDFDNYHFEGTLSDDDVHFDYLLKEGPSVTRNAIGLLKRFSYDRQITERAEEMAGRFLKTGVWSMD
ncbi:MAG: hypothetical protein K5696_09115 [Lachnospiraceae bacterium]|nr:hypothetical protein [Lachnospiraceae bacterium]